MERNFGLEAERTGTSVYEAARVFVSRAALRRMVEEAEVAGAVVAMLNMPGLCGADIDLSAGDGGALSQGQSWPLGVAQGLPDTVLGQLAVGASRPARRLPVTCLERLDQLALHLDELLRTSPVSSRSSWSSRS